MNSLLHLLKYFAINKHRKRGKGEKMSKRNYYRIVNSCAVAAVASAYLFQYSKWWAVLGVLAGIVSIGTYFYNSSKLSNAA